jgi:methylmalonyl-CoA mutase, C-terminal domain
MGPQSTLRILIAKPGLDGHDRGAKVVARALSNAGMEVIYSGLHQTPELIVNTAIDEDVDAIGLSVLSGAHNTIFPRVMKLLEDRGVNDILVFGGGTIPRKDRPGLEALGVGRIFTPGADTGEIIRYLHDTLPGRENGTGGA